jgi:predicted dehydrogenase
MQHLLAMLSGADPAATRAPLRIGLLGTARIADLAVIGPARLLGARLVAVAARDRDRAETWAAANGVERVLDSYQAVIDDPEVEAIYNPLPNSLHAPWNAAAIRAGKHVLTEKPFAANAEEARQVHELAQRSDRTVFEGFHYAYHPIFARLLELIGDGTIGDLKHFHVAMEMPAPGPDDLRWSWPLAGGAFMDLGCYCVHAIRMISAAQGGAPTLLHAAAEERAGLAQIDEWATATFQLPGGAHATALANMDGPWNFSITATGTAGRIHLPDFLHTNDDDRLIVTTDDGERVEHHGALSTYTYQLQAFTGAIRQGRPYVTTTSDSVATMELVDDCYRTAGLRPRESTWTTAATASPGTVQPAMPTGGAQGDSR